MCLQLFRDLKISEKCHSFIICHTYNKPTMKCVCLSPQAAEDVCRKIVCCPAFDVFELLSQLENIRSSLQKQVSSTKDRSCFVFTLLV